MGEITNGVRRILSQPWAYDAFQSLLGADAARREFCSDYLKPGPGNVLVDVGCGTGSIIDHLPRGIRYFGFDHSRAYITAAREKHGDAGTFACKDVRALDPSEIPPCDFAIAVGFLHHLEDAEATQLLSSLLGLLRAGGTLVTLDPAFWAPQSRAARMLISRDRGRNVRSGDGYKALVPAGFSNVRVTRRDDLLNIPYTHAVMECQK